MTDQPDTSSPHPWHRFVALGDSFTEGIGDPDPEVPGGHRGWADRVAEELGRSVAGFEYANLAIRGRLYQQILDEQLSPALELDADLISLFTGSNDVIRRGDTDEIASALYEAVGQLAANGAAIILWTGQDGLITSVFILFLGQVAVNIEIICSIARRYHVAAADLWPMCSLTRVWMWAEYRL